MQDKNQNPLAALQDASPFFVEILRDAVFTSVKKSFPELSKFTKSMVKINHPLQENYGDYSTNIAMLLVKDLHNSPIEIAQKIMNSINDLIKEHQSISYKAHNKVHKTKDISINEVLENISIAGSGFINITLKPDFLISYIDLLLEEKDKVDSYLKSEKVIIEFADPNPYKEFHIGHLRNIALGESYSRLFEFAGATVRRANYQGDVGMHVAKSLWGILHAKTLFVRHAEFSSVSSKEKKILNQVQDDEFKTPKQKAELLGKAYAIGAQAFEENPEAKKEIIELNKKIYRQDAEIIKMWKKYRAWSLEYFDTVYARVGTVFKRFYFESEVSPTGIQIVNSHITDGIFEKSNGAIIYKGEKKGLHTRVFIAKEGYPTYEGKDLALAVLKEKEWPFDLSIIMTGNEQEPYFKVMLSALSDIEPEIAKKTLHVSFGMVNLKEGKMSSRTGNVITADWLLDEAKKNIQEIMKASEREKERKSDVQTISERLAVAAVKYSLLKTGTSNEIAFDIDESISLEGDSGPYLMYTFTRCKSVFRKLKEMKNDKDSVVNFNAREFDSIAVLLSKEELGVLKALYKFPEAVLESTRNFSPNILCTYLFELSQKYNLFYHTHSILGVRGQGSVIRDQSSGISHQGSVIRGQEPGSQQEQVKDFRLWLTDRTSKILQKGLYLLGIETVERM